MVGMEDAGQNRCGHVDITIWAHTGRQVHPLPCSLPANHGGGHWYDESPKPGGEGG
jgi:hypothetical protein